jgi:hypothetical protein
MVPMTDAMQIKVSSDIENRIDDSNSTPARRALERVCKRKPSVDSASRDGASGDDDMG